MMIRVPEAEAAYLDAILHQLHDALGDDLVAVYPTGSLALDGYTPGRSDIDLMCVTAGRPPEPVLRDLAARLDHDRLPCPATGLEFVLYPEREVRAGTVAAGYALDLNTGRELPPKVSTDPAGGPSFWYVIDRDVTYQCGIALYGPPPRTVLRRVPFETLLPIVIESARAHLDAVREHGDNAVLNGARALRFARQRSWYAKPVAARWAREAVPEFADLINAAITSHAAGRAAGRALPTTQVRAFLDHVLAELVDAEAAPASGAGR